ncbi:MAG: response regulator [Gammaproteobacteria bacterium]
MQAHSVLIVEDDRNTRRRIAEIVDAHAALSVAAETGTCESARRYLDTHATPDVMLVDLGLPDGNGVSLIRHARRERPSTEIMVLTVFGDERHVVAAIEAGACGYLLKGDDPIDICVAIVDLLEGKSPISAGIARHILKRLHTPAIENVEPSVHGPRLSAREHEVLELVARGLTYAEIAALLAISVHTVTAHVQNIYGKMQVRSRSEAVFEAVQLGIIELSS